MSESDSVIKEESANVAPQNDKTLLDSILYENILQEIRNMNVLSSYQIHYLRGVSKEQLIEIIRLYNIVMRNVNDVL